MMKRQIHYFLRLLLSLMLAGSILNPLGQAVLAYDEFSVSMDPITIILDGIRDAGYIPWASDPAGDLGDPGSWSGTVWTDLTNLYVAANANYLYIYADLPAYSQAVSAGQIGLLLDVDSNPHSGGNTDPWNNAVTFAYNSIDGSEAPATHLPDYVIRGNIPGIEGGNGWTELLTWNGDEWTGFGTNWGGISGGGQIGTHIAYSNNNGVELAIPLAHLGNPDPASIHVQIFTTQGGSSKGAYDTIPSDDQSATWDDPTTQTQLVSTPLAIDPAGDLASPGPGDWNGTLWTDSTRLHIWADHYSLHLYIPMPFYDPYNANPNNASSGSFLLALDTQPGGGNGVGDPWGNAITLAYNTIWQNLGHTPQPQTAAPDYIIRGNIFSTNPGADNNGWTELRVWNGSNFNTGAGVDWGGIGNSGQPALPNSKVAWSDGDGLRIHIPFADLNVSAGDQINLQFLGTQTSGTKGAFDTVPTDDQSTGWDDPTTQAILASYIIPNIQQPGASHDNDVWWNELGHNSRDATYRYPGGPVPTGTLVSLRLRAASGDLTQAKVRLWNDRTNTQMILNMNLVADDGTYEWWEVVVPPSVDPTVYWYRFIAIDGTDTDYYEDDPMRTGGWGQPYDETADNSWQLTVYDPAFHTPDWLKTAVIYQIFPDRFRDGDPDNHTPPGSFFYGENDTIYRSNQTNWNHPVCDPRNPLGPCAGVWSQNFYGGDLQGLLDKLDYLQSLGITAIYLNPIFESPSNHKYDTTDYTQIDDNFGDETLFETLVQEAANRGIVIILDGVFNHTSSDSIYFDRYGRYPQVGACESPSSPYRSWYTFTDVPPGTGPCAGSDGTPNAATYESWWSYDSLPILNSSNPQVRNLIWASGGNAVGPYWVADGRAQGWRLDVGGDIDAGTINEPDNDYWEGFRSAIHASNPNACIVGEEWGYASSWILGGEWDATMNYQFSTAVLGFWREEPFVDNDHNAGSSAGIIQPLLPSQLNERLLNLQERYPPEAFYAMMNLLGSHDTNRALFMLDHNTDNPGTPYNLPTYDWSDAITRLKGVALLQFTLPGAPTIYYGDEVGLVAPGTWDGSTWQDDPNNRQPYPWLDESGVPFYTHLQTEAGQAVLRDWYTLLITTRNAHPALSIGSFDPLYLNDADLTYAYGRRLLSPTPDAAIIVVNADHLNHSVTVDVNGYLPYGSTLLDVLDNNNSYTVGNDGLLSLPSVPAMSGMLLILDSGDLTPPDAPTNLVAVEGESQVILSWDPVAGAASYNIYRGLVSGGYSLLNNSLSANYTDLDVINGTQYYYVVTAVNSFGLESGYSNEASAMPHWNIDDARLHFPPAITHTIGLTPTDFIYGRVFISDVTHLPGPTPGLLAQVGYGLAGSPPISYTEWVNAEFTPGFPGPDEDEYRGQFVPEYLGEYEYVVRFSTTGGRDWVYADFTGIISPDLPPSQPGVMHVLPSDDTTAPETPQNLRLSNWGESFLELSWDPVTGDPTLYAYDLFRSEISTTLGARIARILAPTTIYTDTEVTGGVTYYYVLQAVDTSFNRSGYSNQVSGTPQPRQVTVTFNVSVPPQTPGTVYIAGNAEEQFGGYWDPDSAPMTYAGLNTWTASFIFEEGDEIEFKFTRGDWDRVEKQADGNTEIPNRTLTVEYGTDGTQIVDLTVANWRDPFLIAYNPGEDATGVPTDTVIAVTWNQSMPEDTNFIVNGPTGPVSGTFTYNDATHTVTFVPAQPLLPATVYTVHVADQVDVVGDHQKVIYTWSFRTAGFTKTILPMIIKH